MKIEVKKIFIPPDRQRSSVTQAKIAELALSIKTHGQLHPITVKPVDRVRFTDIPAHLEYELIAGYRRLVATAFLKEPLVEANLREDLTELQASEIELDENLMRENITFQDEVKAKKKLYEIRKRLYGDSLRDTAEHVGESKSEFWEDVKLAEAMEVIPALKEAKNKTQAKAKLKLLARRINLEKKAEAFNKNKVDYSSDKFMQIALNKIKHGSAELVVKGWADGCLQCVITDPPYGINLDVSETKKGNNHPVIYSDNHYEIMDLYAIIAKEAYRLLAPDTHAYFFFDIKNHAKVLQMLIDAGFSVDPIPLVWTKNMSGQTNDPNSRWGSAYETCFFCRKGSRALIKPGQSNVLVHDMVPAKMKIHPAEKPVSLIRQLIEASTVKGETIGDFFGGSGVTAEAAIQTDRNYLIVEKDPAFHAGIIERVKTLYESRLAALAATNNDNNNNNNDEANEGE